MKRAILLLLLISAPVGAQTWTKSGLETANYKYVDVVIEKLKADEHRIGLTKDRIRTRVELRLRSAGLTPGNDATKSDAHLYVQVTVSGNGFNIAAQYRRLVDFTTGNRRYRGTAATWETGSTGTHARTGAAFIMNALDVTLDKFLNAYLKGNQK